MRYLLCVLILTLLACGPGPSDDSVAGFGSETTNGVVTIALTGADSYANVEVQALPQKFNPVVDDPSKIIKTTPNDTGGVVLDLTVGETYSIYVIDQETGEKVFLPEFKASKDSTVSAELENPGDIKVNFINAEQMLDTVDGYIYIAGYPEAFHISTEFERVGNTIVVNFENVPEALIRTLTYSIKGNESSAQLLSDSVDVKSGDTTNVDALLYFRYMTTRNSPIICDTVMATLVSQNTDGLVWIGTNDGLMRYQNGVFTNHNADGISLESNTIYDINESSDSVTWFGTLNGISRLASYWKNYVKDDPDTLINSNVVYALASTNEGYLWIGTAGGITLLYKNNPPLKIDTRHGIQDNFIIDLAIDCTGTLWGGTFFGYFSISEETDRYVIRTYTVPNTSNADSSGSVSALSVSQSGTVYMGTERGLFSFQPDTPNVLNDITQRDISVSSIITDSKERVWFGVNYKDANTGYTDGHLVLYDGTQLIGYTSQNQRYLPGIEVASLTIDENDNIYCGTVGRGLFLLGPSAEMLFY